MRHLALLLVAAAAAILAGRALADSREDMDRVLDSVNAGLNLGEQVNTGGLSARGMERRTQMQDQDGARVTETVHVRKADGSGEEQDRTWDTEENGGTTVVLQNMNSLEAHVDRSRQKKLEKLREEKAKAAEKRSAQEHKWKGMSEAEKKKDKQKDIEDEGKKEAKQKKAAADEAAKQKDQLTQAANQAKQIKLAGDFKPFGDVYGTKLSTDRVGTMCVISGLMRGSTRAGLIAVLPENCRPTGRIMFMLMSADQTSARVDVKANGEVHWVTGVAGKPWISLSGLSFTVSDNLGLTLVNNWAAFGGEWRAPGLRQQSNLCVVSGLVKNANFDAHIANVNKDCTPEGRLIFSVSNHERVARLDVTANGEILHAGGGQSWGWMALDGILYATGEGTKLDLAQGWNNYGNGYRDATVHNIDNYCVVSGLITFAKSELGFMKQMTTLPANCRPSVRLIFPCNVHDASGRCEVLPDGRVMYYDPAPASKWVSLSAINFVAASK